MRSLIPASYGCVNQGQRREGIRAKPGKNGSRVSTQVAGHPEGRGSDLRLLMEIVLLSFGY